VRRRPTPANILNYLLDEVWKVPKGTRDHSHNESQNWVDEPASGGRIRTHCRLCRAFIGYRPVRRGQARTRQL